LEWTGEGSCWWQPAGPDKIPAHYSRLQAAASDIQQWLFPHTHTHCKTHYPKKPYALVASSRWPFHGAQQTHHDADAVLMSTFHTVLLPYRIFNGASFVFFSFIGFDCVSTLAEEVKNPAVDMPIGIVGCISFVGVICEWTLCPLADASTC
jgi:hypothetical protein